MQQENVIPAEECCMYYQIDVSFIRQLEQHGLISIMSIDEQPFIAHDQLSELERCLHLHNELDINMEGIEAIAHLLQRVSQMQHEITGLRNRLNSYEK